MFPHFRGRKEFTSYRLRGTTMLPDMCGPRQSVEDEDTPRGQSGTTRRIWDSHSYSPEASDEATTELDDIYIYIYT